MTARPSPQLDGLLSCEPFMPQTLQHLTDTGVFRHPLPEPFYAGLLAEYEALQGVAISQIAYASDGLKVTGLMALPTHTSDKAHPVLLYNRGGSHNYGKLTLLSVMRSMVPFARRGYLVFASNYRGNGGGEGQEEFGGRDVDDVMRLLDIACAHPAFDGRNRFMLGHSRGGMMTYLAMRRGAPLNAAISIAGIADLHALAQSPFMVENVLQRLIPGFAGHEQASLDARSALAWPGELTVPLLLLHGDADKDVPADQSTRLAAALETLGRPPALQIYPGGNHALVRHWDAVLARCGAWLEEHRR